jgi:hypothetical protein
MSEIYGMDDAVAAAELAVATGSNLMLRGVGIGLTMLAKRIATLIGNDAPFRAPHDSVSATALLNEADRARGGVLFLDEYDSFNKSALIPLAAWLDQAAREASDPFYSGRPRPPLIVASSTLRPRFMSKHVKAKEDIIGFPVDVEVPMYTLGEIGEMRRTQPIPRISPIIRGRIATRAPGVIDAVRDTLLEGKEGRLDRAREVYERNPARRRVNSLPGPSGRSERRHTQFLVLRVNQSLADTYAVEVGDDVAEALERALDTAVPDEGSIIEYTLVWASDAGAARLMGSNWRPISEIEPRDLIEESEDNPTKPREQTIEEFRRIIQQPGIESLQIAQDLLEEQGVTLVEVSLDQGSRRAVTGRCDICGYVGAGHTCCPPEVARAVTQRMAGGAFYLVGNHDGEGEPEDVFVAWHVKSSGAYYTPEFVITYAQATLVASEESDVTRVPPKLAWWDEAIGRAVEHAWWIVKVMKLMQLRGTIDDLQLAINGQGPFWERRPVPLPPVTPPWLVSSYGRSDPRTPEHFRSNPSPTVSPKALRMYRGFHQKEPKKIGDFHPDLVIPAECICVGDAIHVLYQSDKLNPTTGEDEGVIDYIHKHERGVRIYRCDRSAEGDITAVPSWVRNTTEFDKLGDCNGFAYKSITTGKKCTAEGTSPLPELYCSPNGKCLFIIQGKRRLLALIWGGRLGVEPRGIVH